MRRLLGLALLGLFSWGCADLPTIEAGVCGNHVKEGVEDCDTFADPETPGSKCREKGEVGACHFDCRPGADGVRAQCPANKGCAADGICRAPSGDYQAPIKLSSSVASWLGTLDFDGDERQDVVATEATDRLQQARFQTYYFDDSANLQEVRLFPREVARPTAAQLTKDDLPDLAFCGNRVGMVPGRHDREWLPATFSSYVVDHLGKDSGVRAVSLSDENVSNSVTLVVVTAFDQTPGVYVPSPEGGFDPHDPRFVLDHPVQELAGDPLAADIVEGDDSPCAELVLAFRGESSLQILDMCRLGGADETPLVWREELVEHRVKLPTGKSIDAGPLTADIDGDGHLDLLVGSGGVAYVAFGDGKGVAAEAIPLELATRNVNTDLLSTEKLQMPLAAGDVTGDGIADFVMPDQVLGSRLIRGKLEYYVAYINNGSAWSMAQVADLNDNDLGDVIAAAAGDSNLSFLNGTGGPYPVAQHLATHGPVRQLVVGDFDGDLMGDVAFTEGDSTSEGKDLLAVAYGSRDAAPLPPLRIAEVGKLEQLGRNRDFAVDDIFAASTAPGPAGTNRTTFTLFGGDPARLPLAPYTLVEFEQGENLDDWNALALAAGAISGKGKSDIVALGVSIDHPDVWTQWLILDVANATETPRMLKMLEAPGVKTPDVAPWAREDLVRQLNSAGLAADLDQDGKDEVVWAMPTKDSRCAVLIYELDSNQTNITLRSALEVATPCVQPELQAAPLRVAGKLDLMLRVGSPASGPRQLVLLYNDGKGNFDLDRVQWLNAPRSEDLRAASALEPTKGLVFVTQAGLYRAASAPDSGKVEEDENPAFDELSKLAELDDGRAVVVTDPDGDGISDIVVSDAVGTWLLRAELR